VDGRRAEEEIDREKRRDRGKNAREVGEGSERRRIYARGKLRSEVMTGGIPRRMRYSEID